MSTEIYLGNPPAGRIEWIIGQATKVKYTAASGLADWHGNVNGELNHDSIPNIEQAETVDIGLGVTSIEEEAFSGCFKLTSVTIPDSVTSIGYYAFDECTGLMSFVVGDGNLNYKSVNGLLLSKDGKDLISGVNGDITIPNSVTSIWSGAFTWRKSLTNVTIPDSVTSIGQYAFSNCRSLTSVTIPDSVTSIGDSAFDGCSGLTSVTIGNNVTSIGDGAFSSCSGLTSVTIPNSVTNIKSWAFSGCFRLTGMTIPDSVTSIGSYAFWNCRSLTSVTFLGKAMAYVRGMKNYSWYLKQGCVLHCSDGDITL